MGHRRSKRNQNKVLPVQLAEADDDLSSNNKGNRLSSVSNGSKCCGNCGTIVTVGISSFEAPASQLNGKNFVAVNEALWTVFKVKLEDLNEETVLCLQCIENLQDLYFVWNSFLSKTIQSSLLWRHLKRHVWHLNQGTAERMRNNDSVEPKITKLSLRNGKMATPEPPSDPETRYKNDEGEDIKNEEGQGHSHSESEDSSSNFQPQEKDGGDDVSGTDKQIEYQERMLQRDRARTEREKRQNVPISRPFTCSECGRRFDTEAGVLRHKNMTHLGSGPFICDIENCRTEFRTRPQLEGHMNRHLGIKPHICDQCGWSTTARSLLVVHLKMHLKPAEKEKLKRIICELCGAKFWKLSSLKTHMTSHSDVRPFHCSYEGCKSKFKRLAKLKFHEKEIHLDIYAKYPCERCGREFRRRSNLHLHLRTHEKYEQNGREMRKSRDPPIRSKIKTNVVEPDAG